MRSFRGGPVSAMRAERSETRSVRALVRWDSVPFSGREAPGRVGPRKVRRVSRCVSRSKTAGTALTALNGDCRNGDCRNYDWQEGRLAGRATLNCDAEKEGGRSAPAHPIRNVVLRCSPVKEAVYVAFAADSSRTAVGAVAAGGIPARGAPIRRCGGRATSGCARDACAAHPARPPPPRPWWPSARRWSR